MQKDKKASITLSLRQEIEREAQKIEEEIEQHPELEQIRVTEEMDQAFWEKIRAYEKEVEEEEQVAKMAEAELREPHDVEFSEELVPDMSAWRAQTQRDETEKKCMGENEKGKTVYRRKKKKYWVISLAAVLVIVLGVGMNSVGSKSYWKNLWKAVRGEPMNGIDIEDMNKQNTEDVDEIAAYREIEEKIHIKPVRFLYQPDYMKLVDYEIREEILTARLLYKYQDEVIKYNIYVSDVDSSWGEKEEDIKINDYILSVNDIAINIEEFQVENSLESRQVASFEYQGVHYELKGIMKKEEFDKIVKNLYFF